MISHLIDLPSTMVGFKASGEVTCEDFQNVVMPAVQAAINRNGTLNYLLVLNTELGEFTSGAWLQDVIMGAKHFLKWNRAAIVSDVKGIRVFTDLFSKVMPGEFKGFQKSEMQQAIDWCSGQGLTGS